MSEPPGGDGRQPVLELEDVSFAHRVPRGFRTRRRPVLRGVGLRVGAGEVVGLVGVNGAGKTTLLEIAAGARVPSSGTVRRFGRRLRGRKARAEIGYCPDSPSFPPYLSVGEVLELFGGLKGLSRGASRAARRELCRRLGLGGVVGDRAGELSRGETVRLGIAQALAGAPGLVLLDESFASLDPPGQRELRGVIREEAERGAAVVVSSHQLGQLERVVDRVHLLHGGKILGPVEREELRADRLEELVSDAARGPSPGG